MSKYRAMLGTQEVFSFEFPASDSSTITMDGGSTPFQVADAKGPRSAMLMLAEWSNYEGGHWLDLDDLVLEEEEEVEEEA